jgi:adenylate cyclase class 2
MANQGQETEAKFYVRDLKNFETRLRAPPPFGHLPQIPNNVLRKSLSSYSRIWGRLGGSLIQSRVLEMNIRFDLPDASLRSESRVLRLRRDTEARLTYKSASTNEQGVLSRTEIEFIVEDFETAKQFLEALGYQPIFYYEKYRTTYELDGVLIMLDELPYGNFVEIEGETIEGIRKASEALKLNWNAAIGTSYFALFGRACKTLNLSFQDLSFENFAGIQVTAAQLGVSAAEELI